MFDIFERFQDEIKLSVAAKKSLETSCCFKFKDLKLKTVASQLIATSFGNCYVLGFMLDSLDKNFPHPAQLS